MSDKKIHIARRYSALFSLALGGLAATGFAPLQFWPIALACFGVWMWLIHDAPSLKRALLNGWLFGVAHFTVGNNWIQHAFEFQDAMPHWLGYGAVVLMSLYLALYPMLAAGLAWRFASPRSVGDSTTTPSTGFVLVFAASWIVAEWLRGTMFTGYPWNPLGVIWVPLPGVARVAAIVGTYALSGLTIAVAGAAMLLAFGRWRFAAPLGGVTLLLALIGIGGPNAPRGDVTAPRVRVVQPNLPEEDRPGPNYAENNFRALAALSGAPGPAPRLLVWPEGAIRFMLEDGYPSYTYWRGSADVTRRRIAALLGPNDIVLTGGNSLKFDARDEVIGGTNSVFAIGADARLLGRYDKAHLVPYGEYLPARPILSRIGLSRLVPGDFDFLDGPGPHALDLPHFGSVGIQICYEIIFSGQTVDRAHRPAVIFNPSNDAWYGPWGPPEHLAQARLRAIEEGLPIIRATPTGISAIIDAEGRVLASVPAETAGAIELAIPPAHAPTIFARVGNLMAFLVAAAMLLLAVAIRRWSR
ncbi:apolipoprotein N-acyltransferase [Sphingomonas sp. So64.6b]|uniref:apolipoprotein N-acyltransferase n=1 Tax=Sphingomonas sp. So64.6b TaxID=2997354 RepID=UPI001FCE852F|nr:apolipoprotein N-acyltransferase [Sphingomonas sp. So64.6b]